MLVGNVFDTPFLVFEGVPCSSVHFLPLTQSVFLFNIPSLFQMEMVFRDHCLGLWRLPVVKRKKKSTCQFRRHGFDPWVRKIPWRRKWQPTPEFLPGKFHGQRSLVGYSPWSCKSRTQLSTTGTVGCLLQAFQWTEAANVCFL